MFKELDKPEDPSLSPPKIKGVDDNKSPTVTENPVVTGVRETALSIPASVGALGTGAALVSAGTPVGWAVLASMGLGFGYDYLFRKSLPESIQKASEQGRAQNPKAALVGDIAGNLPTLKMSGPTTMRALEASKKLLFSGAPKALRPALTTAEKSALKAVATGSAISAGVETGAEVASEGKVDPSRVGIAALGGIPFNDPRGWTKRVPFISKGINKMFQPTEQKITAPEVAEKPSPKEVVKTYEKAASGKLEFKPTKGKRGEIIPDYEKLRELELAPPSKQDARTRKKAMAPMDINEAIKQDPKLAQKVEVNLTMEEVADRIRAREKQEAALRKSEAKYNIPSGEKQEPDWLPMPAEEAKKKLAIEKSQADYAVREQEMRENLARSEQDIRDFLASEARKESLLGKELLGKTETGIKKEDLLSAEWAAKQKEEQAKAQASGKTELSPERVEEISKPPPRLRYLEEETPTGEVKTEELPFGKEQLLTPEEAISQKAKQPEFEGHMEAEFQRLRRLYGYEEPIGVPKPPEKTKANIETGEGAKPVFLPDKSPPADPGFRSDIEKLPEVYQDKPSTELKSSAELAQEGKTLYQKGESQPTTRPLTTKELELAGQHKVAKVNLTPGEDFRGRVNTITKEIDYNPEAATSDTLPHEVSHLVLERLRAKDPEFASRMESILGGTSPQENNEKFIQLVGERVSKILELRSKSGQWFPRMKAVAEDIYAGLKARFGDASVNDYKKALSRKVLDEVVENVDEIDSKLNVIAKQPKTSDEVEAPALGDKPRSRALPGFTISTEALKKPEHGREGQYIAPRITKLIEKTELDGEGIANRLKDTIHKAGSFSDMMKLHRHFQNERLKQAYLPKTDFTPKMLKAYNEIRTILRKLQEDRIAAKQPVIDNGVAREAGIDPFYYPLPMEASVAKTLRDYPSSPEAEQILNKLVEFTKQNHPDVDENVVRKAIVEKYSAAGNLGKTVQNLRYGPTRKPEGDGIPIEFAEPNFDRAFERFSRRWAADRNFFDLVESDPKARNIVGLLKDPWNPKQDVRTTWENGELVKDLSNTSDLKPILEYIANVNFQDDWLDRGARGIAKSIMLQIGTGAGNLVTGPFLFYKRAPLSFLGSHLKNIVDNNLTGRVFEDFSEAAKAGFIKKSPILRSAKVMLKDAGIKNLKDLSWAALDANELIYNVTKMIGKLSTSEFLEYAGRTYNYSAAKLLYASQKAKALAGNKWSQRFMKELGVNNVEKLTPEEDKLALYRLFKSVQGDYGPTGQPKWMLKHGGLRANFLSLARWAISQTQDTLDVIKSRGVSEVPKILALGILGGGAAATVRSLMFRKNFTGLPTITSIFQSSEGDTLEEKINNTLNDPTKVATLSKTLLAYFAVGGIGGIAGDATKAIIDVATKQRLQGINIPHVQIYGNIAGDSVRAMQDLFEGVPPMEVAKEYLGNVGPQNMQTLNYLRRQWAPSFPEFLNEERIRREQLDQAIRDFNLTTGEKITRSPMVPGSIFPKRVREALERGDLKTAGELLDAMIEKVERESKDIQQKAKGYENLMKMENVPGPARDTLEYRRLTNYLGKTNPEMLDRLNKAYSNAVESKKFRTRYVAPRAVESLTR